MPREFGRTAGGVHASPESTGRMPLVDVDALLVAAARALRPVLGPASLVAAAGLPGSDRSTVLGARVRTDSD